MKARKRVYGGECKRPIPPTIPYWMKETSSIDGVAGGNPSSGELISSGFGDEATDGEEMVLSCLTCCILEDLQPTSRALG